MTLEEALLALAGALVSDQEEPKDVLGDAVTRLFARDARGEVAARIIMRAARYSGAGKPEAFLHGVAAKIQLDQRRAAARAKAHETPFEDDLPGRDAGPEELAMLGDVRRRFRELAEADANPEASRAALHAALGADVEFAGVHGSSKNRFDARQRLLARLDPSDDVDNAVVIALKGNTRRRGAGRKRGSPGNKKRPSDD